MKISKLISFSLAAVLTASCTQTDLFDGAADMSGMVDYSLYAGRPTSRATVLDNTNFATFKVYSYQNIEETATPGSFAFSAYYDETVNKSTTWAGIRPRRWATGANDFLNFYAYSDETNADNYVAATGVAAHATFDYTVPTVAADQQDLLVSAAFSQQEKTNQGKLNLDFKHALTQVAFKVKSATPSFEVKVSKVELIGANSKATFSYDGTTNVVGAWSAAGTAADYAFEVETPAAVDNADFVAIASATGNLMMIPDAAPSAVKIRVTYNLVVAGAEDADELIKEIELKEETVADGTVTNPITPWAMGKKITYNLTLPGKANKIIFGDATMTGDWDATGEETNAEAKDIFGESFITLTDGFANTAGYPLEINDNRATAGTFTMTSDAAWVKFSETANDFAGAQTTLANVTAATRAIIAKKIYVYADNNNSGTKRTATIKMIRDGYSVVTLEITQDLPGALLSGANSYIITDAGFYTLDATVKGNGKQVALPDGYDAVANPATAIPLTEAELAITGAAKAEVLWETVNTTSAPAKGSIVKDVALFANGVVMFNTTATQGNAVIVVKDASNKILWSWHIWRTNQEPIAQELKPITATTGTFTDGSTTISGLKIMDRNIGTLSATPQSDLSGGLIYQWGRKDPFPGSSALSNSTLLMAVTGVARTVAAGGASITPDIAASNPTVFYTGSDWTSRNDNLWGTPLTSTVAISGGTFNSNAGSKTIYDPCPKGWRLAGYALANASTTTSGTNNKGYSFDILTSGRLWIPFVGYFHATTGAFNVGSSSMWSSSSSISGGGEAGCNTLVGANVLSNQQQNRALGTAIRCTQE